MSVARRVTTEFPRPYGAGPSGGTVPPTSFPLGVHMSVRKATRLLLVASLMATSLVALAGGAAQAAISQVNVIDFAFVERDITVKAGDTVVWRWVGQDAHTVTGSDFSFDSGIEYKGASYAVTFDEPGVVPYFCKLHGSPDGEGMAGSVTVLPADGVRMAATSDNVATAIAWSKQTVPDGGASTALLGRSDLFADSLSSSPLQGKLGAPLLLTPSTSLDNRVKNELNRIGAGQVIIMGGESAISKSVEDALVAAGYGVTRIAGPTRIGTAATTASRYFRTSDAAFLARAYPQQGLPSTDSQAFADSLGGGAAAAKMGIPMLLTETDKLSAETEAYLKSAGVTTVYLAGGEGAISKAVEDKLTGMGITVVRLGGANRFETSVIIGTSTMTFEEDVAIVIDGSGGNPDAWASGFAAALRASQGGLLIVADGATVPDGWVQALFNLLPAVICGPGASAAACDEVVIPTTVPALEEAEGVLGWATEPVAAGGDPAEEAAGNAGLIDLRPTSDPGTVCFNWRGMFSLPVADSHIHRVSDNTVAIPTGPGNEEGDVYGCSTVDPAVVADVLANPQNYFWNLHFAETSAMVRGDVVAPGDLWFFGATSDQEVPPSTAGEDAFAFGAVFPNEDVPGEICVGYFHFLFGEMGPKELTGAHIHEGHQGENGPIVVTLPLPANDTIVAAGCVTSTEAQIDAIAADPNGFYANLHTADNPDGAVRGQLWDLAPAYPAPQEPTVAPASFGRAAASWQG